MYPPLRTPTERLRRDHARAREAALMLVPAVLVGIGGCLVVAFVMPARTEEVRLNTLGMLVFWTTILLVLDAAVAVRWARLARRLRALDRRFAS